MKLYYQIAAHTLSISGELCHTVPLIAGFKPFATEATEEPVLEFMTAENSAVPTFQQVEYTLEYEDVKGAFGLVAEHVYMLSLTPEGREALYMWADIKQGKAYLAGNQEVYLLRFAMWVGFGLLTCQHNTVAIHSSCIVYNNKAVIFLGESGTGKSTHTRLWRQHIKGATLLNDDSPILRVENGKVWAYGSPWSGKTPCYKNQRYELAGCVRLSQAPHNAIKRLTVLQGYGALHPSCPPEFAYDGPLYDEVSNVISELLSAVPVYHLECLPDKAAAELSCQTVFG